MRRLSVYVTDEAFVALRSAAAVTGLSEVDTISRALTTYGALMVMYVGEPIRLYSRHGGPSFTVVVLDRQGMPEPPVG